VNNGNPRIIGHHNDMIHVVYCDTIIDNDGINRVKGKPNDIPGVWILESMLNEPVQLSLF